MLYEIKNRFTGSVIYTADLECDENASDAVKLGLAVVAAVKAKAYLSWADLSGAYLSRTNLSRANLSRTDLSGADLSWADLSGAYLSRTNLSRTDLSGADLSWADLSGAYLSRTNLSRANLSRTDLSGANLLAYGDMKYLRTMQIDTWAIGYTHDTLQIGCQRHAIDKWRKWDTDAGRKWIAAMDDNALEWAERNLALVLQIIDANPALVPDLGKAGSDGNSDQRGTVLQGWRRKCMRPSRAQRVRRISLVPRIVILAALLHGRRPTRLWDVGSL
jgi:uncharacterized protein YjbI with pentapeptide repeats